MPAFVATFIVIALAAPAPVAQQAGDKDLATGIRQVEEGDLEAAVVTLGGVVKRLTGQKGREADMAAAHLYLALAHLGLNRADRAKSSVRDAWRSQPNLAIDPKRFPPIFAQYLDEAKREAASVTPGAADRQQAEKARSLLQEQAAWDLVKDSRDARTLEAFLREYPAGRYAAQAKAQLEALSAAATAQERELQVQQEQIAWDLIKDTRDQAVLESFLKRFPQGAHAKVASDRLAGLKPNPNVPQTKTENGIEWLLIPSGSFEMGCTPGDTECMDHERPAHTVALTRPFWLMATEVTVGQYRGREGDQRPVVNVKWNEATRYCESIGGRLPTEEEWEYSARGGHSGWRYPWGNEIDHDRANFAGTGGMDRWAEVAPVRSFPPNAFGLYDMAGNVWEWVADYYSGDSYAAASRPTGPSSGAHRVVRGGAWFDRPSLLRVSARYSYMPHLASPYVGFRCARDTAPQGSGSSPTRPRP